MAFEPNSYPICIDTGASACLSNDASHFISLNPIQQMTINGIGSGLEVKGVGIIRLLVLDDKGNEVELTVKNVSLFWIHQCVSCALIRLHSRQTKQEMEFMP